MCPHAYSSACSYTCGSFPGGGKVLVDVHVISTHFFLDFNNNDVRVSHSFVLTNLKSLRIFNCAIPFFFIIVANKCLFHDLFPVLGSFCSDNFYWLSGIIQSF